MANGLDYLERLFAKRKISAASAESNEAITEPTASTAEPQFPSPSFIRPKASRMAAREEVSVKHTTTRSAITSERCSQSSSRVSSGQGLPLSADSHHISFTPTRTSSLKHRQIYPMIEDLREFKFPCPPTHNGEISPASSAAGIELSNECFGKRGSRSRSPRQNLHRPARLNTPPTSDPEDETYRSSRYFMNKRLPDLPPGALPTPSQSPDLWPVDSQSNNSTSFNSQRESYDMCLQLEESLGQNRRQTISSSSDISHSTNRLSVSSSTLREPDFNEFLTLSDDDIAELSPENSTASSSHNSLQPSLMPLAAPSPQSLLTLTPPAASRPATAAAFEAARIANRYNFDLVYVVNLWPDSNQPRPLGLEQEDSISINSDVSAKPLHGMTGRLLAAYGLHNVTSPFQISSAVHGKILRTPGWIEWRNQEARNDEFARGYGCAFYTGQYSKTGSIISTNSSCSSRYAKADRGIVFAAYRIPRPDGSVVGVGSSQEELAEVHGDAEALVEMLIDIHVANRLRQPQSQDSDETGPMPVPRKVVTHQCLE